MSDRRWPTRAKLYRDFGLTPPEDFGQRLYESVSEEQGVNEKHEMTVREAGRRGGRATAERHGPEFFQENGRRGGHRVRELIERGKRDEVQEEQNHSERTEDAS